MEALIKETINRYSSVSEIKVIDGHYYELFLVSFNGIPNWSKLKSHCEEIETMIGQSCRVLIPMPGTTIIGVEIPKVSTEGIEIPDDQLSKVMTSEKTPLLLGLNTFNEPLVIDMGYDEDFLFVGQDPAEIRTAMDSLLRNLRKRYSEEDLQVNFIRPQEKNDEQLILSFKSVLDEIEYRRTTFNRCHVRNIGDYNSLQSQKMPRLVVVIDNLNNIQTEYQSRYLDYIEEITLKDSAMGIYVFASLLAVGSNKEQKYSECKRIFSNTFFQKITADKSQYWLGCNDAEFLKTGGDMLYFDGAYSYRFHILNNNFCSALFIE